MVIFTANTYQMKWALLSFSMKSETDVLKAAIQRKIAFCYYRLAKDTSGILSYAKEGTRL